MAADLSKSKGFRGGFCVDIYGSHQLLEGTRQNVVKGHSFWRVWHGFFAQQGQEGRHPV